MPHFKAMAKGRIRLQLADEELEVMRTLPVQLRDVIQAREDRPVLERLLPPAYGEPEDRERQEEYRSLMTDDLLQAKLAAIDVLAGTLERGKVSRGRWSVTLESDEATAWLGVLNDLRLTLGVRLGIEEATDYDVSVNDPRAPAVNLLHYLGWLEEQLIEALSAG